MQFSKSFRLSEIGCWEPMGRRGATTRRGCRSSPVSMYPKRDAALFSTGNSQAYSQKERNYQAPSQLMHQAHTQLGD